MRLSLSLSLSLGLGLGLSLSLSLSLSMSLSLSLSLSPSPSPSLRLRLSLPLPLPLPLSLPLSLTQVENVEYLRGQTHYIAVTVKKVSLLNHGVLLKDRSALDGAPLLSRANVDDAKLLTLARTVATHIGLPETTQFAQPHPAKLFDFSTRARCLAPFKVRLPLRLLPRCPVHPTSHLSRPTLYLLRFTSHVPPPHANPPCQYPMLIPLSLLATSPSVEVRRAGTTCTTCSVGPRVPS